MLAMVGLFAPASVSLSSPASVGFPTPAVVSLPRQQLWVSPSQRLWASLRPVCRRALLLHRGLAPGRRRWCGGPMVEVACVSTLAAVVFSAPAGVRPCLPATVCLATSTAVSLSMLRLLVLLLLLLSLFVVVHVFRFVSFVTVVAMLFFFACLNLVVAVVALAL